ncbi:PREDICTED: uncharacterized protein LOC105556806 [Vollenhovia emeryi]|uniref:uncharacterized protein LOC105556806 n=1 Tax=Vollenhovia emeryi TaxID=411798 RepID=UPI0005F4B3E4|nr:PREDICTED: uncharacterized protein LOC105556806 [Vollenhovia emeryi]
MADETKTGKADRPKTPALEVPPGDRTSGRTVSPARLPTDLALKVQTQMGWIATLRELTESLPDVPAETSLEEVSQIQQLVEETHKAFIKEHAYFEMSWPAALTQHEYFAENAHQAESRCYLQARRVIGVLRHALAPAQPAQPTTSSSAGEARQTLSRLPDISLPKFTGEYAAWPAFRDLFTSLIMQNEQLTNVERLHYLRSSVEGAPAQLIAGFIMAGGSLTPSWELLKDRYENKRLLIHACLDKLFASSTPVPRKAASLDRLVSGVREALKGLEALEVMDKLGDCAVVYHVTRLLDRVTREQWENAVGATQDYPTFEKLEEFLTTKRRALERIETTTAHPGPSLAPSPPKTAHQTTQQSDSSYPCDCCNAQHFIVMCTKFRELSPSARHKVAIDKRLCFNCLGRYSMRACKSQRGCKTCSGRHHTMLHGTNPLAAPAQKTALALVNSSTTHHSARLLIDTGSELTFVTENLIRQLNIPRHYSGIVIQGIAGKECTRTRGVVSLTLRSKHSSATATVRAHVLRTVTSILPSFEAEPEEWPHLRNLALADPDFLIPRPVDILIGADAYGQIIKPNIIRHSPLMPIAQLSIFGWLVLGPVNREATRTSTHQASTQVNEDALNELLTKFWVQEEVPTHDVNRLTPDEQRCEEHFKATHSRDSSGRYVVRIPLKSPADLLGDSYHVAHQCLKGLRRRFSRDVNYQRLYQQFMMDYETLNHMTKASSISSRRSHFYLPHHGVLKPDSTTTKLRVVFNGSSASSSGYSVNDLMYTGAKLHLNISDVLLWIRRHRHSFATDITKMYRQINIHKDDWELQRILWMDDQLNEVPYHLTTVTYGTKAAPFLAVRTLLQLAEDEGHNYPLAVPSITHGRYVDDIFGGADTIQQLQEVAHQLKGLCMAGGFPLAKWHATHLDILRTILGLKWLPQEDTFAFSTRSSRSEGRLTKRLVLSEVAQIFDPLGFASPVVIKAKILLQELWLHKLQWDDPLPSQLSARWLSIREELTSLARLSIPRWLKTWSDSQVELHGFSDASQLAMAAVIYISVHDSNGATFSLVCSKTKVAPLKRLSIPRLELTAALLLSRLMQYVEATLNMDVTATHMWTDSLVTLSWIRSHASRWKDFVRNRVAQIQELTPAAHWRYIPGTSNPADCASRGLTATQLQNHALWWTGPPWILNSDLWPSQPALSEELSATEARPGVSLLTATPRTEYQWELIYRYSSLTKLLRITALCFRFISRLRKVHDSLPARHISPETLEKARLFWIQATQAAYFSHELKALQADSPLAKAHAFNRLTAYIDAQGVIRVGGRLAHAALSLDAIHPVILPRHSPLSSLIIAHAHQRTLHGGTQLTLSHIR